MYQDKILICKDCGKEFTFTRGEQEFYASKGFENEPTRCKECRARRKARTSNGEAKPTREYYVTTCANCGKEARVPFKPREDRPVLCSACYALKIGAQN